MSEQWLPIPEQAGYEVSNHGRVRSYILRARTELAPRPRLLKPDVRRGGYQVVRLNGKKAFFVHRIVMLAFVGPAPAGREVDHIDSDPSNNRLENLQYVTKAQNYALRSARLTTFRCGHSVVGNTYWHKATRTCRQCKRQAWREATARQRAKRAEDVIA